MTQKRNFSIKQARMLELVDNSDLKSDDHTVVRVRISLRVRLSSINVYALMIDKIDG